MAAKDTKLSMNGGAYSLKYQLLEQERLRRFQQEQKDNGKSVRERAHLLSKQTQQRRRALEDKKQAMAKAEEDRRKAALEERRRQQKEATQRFRSAISRQPKHSKSHITLEAIHSRPRQQTPPTSVTRSNSKPPSVGGMDRVVYGREVEIPHPALLNMGTFTVIKDPPDLDEVLENIRAGGRSSDHTPSIESIILPSPEPTNLLDSETTPLFDKPTLLGDMVSNNSNVSINSNNGSDESTISLHDSIDEPIQVINNPPIDRESSILQVNASTPNEIESRPLINEEQLTKPLINEESPLPTDEVQPSITEERLVNEERVIDTNNKRPSSTNEPPANDRISSFIANERLPRRPPFIKQPHSNEESEIREEDEQERLSKAKHSSIKLQPHSNEDIGEDLESQKKGILKKSSCTSLSRGPSGKKVRFSETVNEHQKYLAKTSGRMDTTSILIPKMRISLNNAKLSSVHPQHVLSSTVTKLNGGGRNGIVIHVPPAGSGMYPSDNSTNVWSSMGAYVHDEPVSLAPPPERKMLVGSNSNNMRQLPVKLWKRSSKNVSQGESSEELRLMESIELINNRLRALPTNGMTTINMEPSVTDPPYLTRSPPTQQYKRQLTKSPLNRHRTRYK